MTIRPIFRPSVRVSDCWPSRVGCGAGEGLMGSESETLARLDLTGGAFGVEAAAGAGPREATMADDGLPVARDDRESTAAAGSPRSLAGS